jgi:hypothetical protein
MVGPYRNRFASSGVDGGFDIGVTKPLSLQIHLRFYLRIWKHNNPVFLSMSFSPEYWCYSGNDFSLDTEMDYLGRFSRAAWFCRESDDMREDMEWDFSGFNPEFHLVPKENQEVFDESGYPTDWYNNMLTADILTRKINDFVMFTRENMEDSFSGMKEVLMNPPIPENKQSAELSSHLEWYRGVYFDFLYHAKQDRETAHEISRSLPSGPNQYGTTPESHSELDASLPGLTYLH